MSVICEYAIVFTTDKRERVVYNKEGKGRKCTMEKGITRSLINREANTIF
jgi:hypothetical protein